jgi:predicted glycosyltransferase
MSFDPSPVILFQCPNQVGLGHLSRLAAIAVAVRRIDQGVRVPFVIEGGSHSFLEACGLPYLVLPQPQRNAVGWISWDVLERREMAIALSLVMIRQTKPDVVVFDCFPSSAFMVAASKCRVPMAMCLRKMRDLPLYFNRMKHILPLLGLILVVHESGEMDLPDDIKNKTIFVGGVARTTRLAPLSEVRKSNHGTWTIVITGGGGGYPGTVDFYNLALEAILRVRRRRPLATGLLVTGPLFKEWLSLELVDGVRVIPFDPDIVQTFLNSQLVICQGGYNTLAELATLGTEAICIPAPRKFDDQFDRVARLAQLHPHIHAFRGTTSIQLAETIETCLDINPKVDRPFVIDGAMRAAEELHAFILRARQ